MESWDDILVWVLLGIFILLALYITIHMIYNRMGGKDELEGLFVFRRRKRDRE